MLQPAQVEAVGRCCYRNCPVMESSCCIASANWVSRLFRGDHKTKRNATTNKIRPTDSRKLAIALVGLARAWRPPRSSAAAWPCSASSSLLATLISLPWEKPGRSSTSTLRLLPALTLKEAKANMIIGIVSYLLMPVAFVRQIIQSLQDILSDLLRPPCILVRWF